MSTIATAPHSEPVVSFRDAEHAALVVTLGDGSIFGWPLHLLTQWSLSGLPTSQELSVAISDVVVEISGERLGGIASEIAASQRGLELTAHDERYRALADPKRPFISKINVLENSEDPE